MAVRNAEYNRDDEAYSPDVRGVVGVPAWHTRCDNPACYYRCRRPNCTRVDSHVFARFDRAARRYEHKYDCTITADAARVAVEDLQPGLSSEELAVARRILQTALDELEHLRGLRQRRVGD